MTDLREELGELSEMMDLAMEQIVSTVVSISKNDKYFEAVGTCYYKFYKGLLNAGFTTEEAMAIVQKQGFFQGQSK
jgi:hypothetical protein